PSCPTSPPSRQTNRVMRRKVTPFASATSRSTATSGPSGSARRSRWAGLSGQSAGAVAGWLGPGLSDIHVTSGAEEGDDLESRKQTGRRGAGGGSPSGGDRVSSPSQPGPQPEPSDGAEPSAHRTQGARRAAEPGAHRTAGTRRRNGSGGGRRRRPGGPPGRD